MAGLDYRDIAAQMQSEGFGEKYSHATVCRDIKYAKEQAHAELKETAVDALTLELMRLEQLHRAWWLPAVGLSPADPEETPDAQTARNFFVNIPNPPTAIQDPNAPPIPIPPKMAKPDPAAARVVLATMGHRLKLMDHFAKLEALGPPSDGAANASQKAIEDMSMEEIDAFIGNLTGG